MHQLTIRQAQKNFKGLIQEVIKGEEIILTEKDKPFVKFIPLSTQKKKPIFGSAKGLIKMSDDFDEPLEDFKEYME